jgi:acylphosphatase
MAGMSEKARLHAVITGRVQGVAYRYFAQRHAQACGVTGWVRNLFDGRVEILAEGERERLDLFLTRLREGPRMAAVDAVDVRWDAYTGEFAGFEITGLW